MRIVTIKRVKPDIICAATKLGLMNAIIRRYGCVMMVGDGCTGYRCHEFGRHAVKELQWLGINMEKRRKKRNKRDSGWFAWVYRIPVGCGVKQGPRTFTLLLPKDTSTNFRKTAERQ